MFGRRNDGRPGGGEGWGSIGYRMFVQAMIDSAKPFEKHKASRSSDREYSCSCALRGVSNEYEIEDNVPEPRTVNVRALDS